MEEEEASGHVTQECSFFGEKAAVIAAVQKLCSSESAYEQETILNDVSKVLLKYQEQPHLLGPHVEDLVSPVNDALVRFVISTPQAQQDEGYLLSLCKFYQLCCRVRGFKQVAKHLPHEVYQLEPCCELLARQNMTNYHSWEIRYVLLLWLSSLVLIPFDLSSMDSHSDHDTHLVQKLIQSSLSYIGDPGPIREAAGFCLANLLTRPDMETHHLQHFLDQSAHILRQQLADPTPTTTTTTAADTPPCTDPANPSPSSATSHPQHYFQYIGILACCNQIFKRGHRHKLLPCVARIYPIVIPLAGEAHRTIERKLLCKLIQRIGMTCLPPKEATWRYQRGKRSLPSMWSTAMTETSLSPVLSPPAPSTESKGEGEEEEYPEELEEIIGMMFHFLSDADTVVRWSAAKGLGRLAMRLSQSLATDIVHTLGQQFEAMDADSAWHGGCLAMAELARRGLLLPVHLPEVMDHLAQAVHYDVLRGQHSVGSHVRDAACYVYWALARAYASQDLLPYHQDCFVHLLLTCLYDREVHCRRAASAALQEWTGRQGFAHFPESLQIISIADFVAVGHRTQSYLELAPQIASLHPSYHAHCVQHLLQRQLQHWDEDLRILSAQALARLFMLKLNLHELKLNLKLDADSNFSLPATSSCAEATDGIVACLQVLLPRCTQSTRLADRHGAFLGVSTLCVALATHPRSLPSDLQSQFETMLVSVDKLRLFRGKGGERVRVAVCDMLTSLLRLRWTWPTKVQLALLDLLVEQIKQPHEAVQRSAQSALRVCLFVFWGDVHPWRAPTDKLLAMTVQKWMASLRTETNVASVRGLCLALGCLPQRLVGLEECAQEGCAQEGCAPHTEGLLPPCTASSPLPPLPPDALPPGLLRDVLTLLADWASPSKRLLGEHDAEASRNAVEALVELTERLAGLETWPLVALRYVLDVLLFSAGRDYSIDKRGDIGSWSRILALRGLQRILLRAFPRILPHTRGISEELPVSVDAEVGGCGVHCARCVQTVYGQGHVCEVVTVSTAPIARVAYLPQSLGAQQNELESWTGSHWQPPAQLVAPLHPATAEALSAPPPRTAAAAASPSPHFAYYYYIPAETLLQTVLCLVYKQLGERLDSVREVAGQVWHQLVTWACAQPVCRTWTSFPSLESQAELLHRFEHSRPGERVVRGDKERVGGMWSQAAHVFPLLVDVLRAQPVYLPAVFEGLVASVGGVSKTQAKAAGDSLLALCASPPSSVHSGGVQGGGVGSTLRGCILDLFRGHVREDRVILPLLKTVQFLLQHDKLRTSSPATAMDYPAWVVEIMHCLQQEMRRCTSVPKLCVVQDVLALLVSSLEGAEGAYDTRRTLLHTAIKTLAHKYPKVRKHGAEVLYLLFLSISPDVLGGADNSHDSSAVQTHCSEVLLSTAWESDEADTVFAAMNEILQSLGWEPVARTQPSQRPTTRQQAADELDSYETLVRDAGY